MGTTKHELVSGKVGNLIFYEYRGKPCCRSTPDSIRQTAGMKKSASRFGFAAKISKFLRFQLKPFLSNADDKPMMYGFNKAIMQWLRESKPDENTFSTSNFFIDQFQFNKEASLAALVKQPISTSFSEKGAITIKVPALTPGKDIIAPAGTVNIHYKARVVSVMLDFDRGDCIQVGLRSDKRRGAEAVLEYGKKILPAQKLSLYLQQEERVLMVVVLRILYEVKKGNRLQMVSDERWLPAGVVGACFGVKG